MSTHLVRPTTLAELRACQKNFVTKESIERGLAFQPRPTDVIVTPYSKSGTTWVQQIVHGLRTRGAMDFREITQVVPWIELASDLGIDLDQPQVAEPRAFKSHLGWDQVPKGGRYINVVRDPKDVVVSMYHFMNGWYFETGAISLTQFAWEEFMRNRGPHGYWSHLRSWWPHRNDPDVLFMCYEDMKQDLPGTVRRIAAFIGCALDAALFDIVVRQSSVDFMREHTHQFDDNLLREARDEACGLPPGGDSSKVRTGNVGDHAQELSQNVIDELDVIWREEIEAQLGFVSYAALRAALAR